MVRVTLVNADELKQYPPEKVIGEFAAVCYDTNTDRIKPENIAKRIIETDHGSPQSAVSFRFEVRGISRVESHQHVRHNVGIRHNQRSQRYVDEDGCEFITPPSIAQDPIAFLEYQWVMAQTKKSYVRLKELGIPGEDARYVLPNATETKINSVFTYEALVHFCHKRLCNRAQWEIREVARQMVAEVEKVSPMLASYLVPKCGYDGYCREKKGCCGLMPTKEEVLSGYHAQEKMKRDLAEAMITHATDEKLFKKLNLDLVGVERVHTTKTTDNGRNHGDH